MIIGVAGKKRSGKDTFYTLLKEKISSYYTVKRYAFADEVKEYAVNYFHIDRKDIKDENNRFLLQGIGQMFREEVNENYWINQTMMNIRKSQKNKPGEISVITDVRYINEAQEIQNQENGFLIKIVNKNTETFDPHISENNLDDYEFDYVMKNNGSLDDYRSEVDTWVKSHLPWIHL